MGTRLDYSRICLFAVFICFLSFLIVITQTVFKTKGAGDGFRRFQLGEGAKLGVLRVDDLVEVMPFEGASNRTATVVLERGRETKYPVSYTVWWKKAAERVDKGIETSP